MKKTENLLEGVASRLRSQEMLGLCIVLLSPLYEKMQQRAKPKSLFNLSIGKKALSLVNPPGENSILKAQYK